MAAQREDRTGPAKTAFKQPIMAEGLRETFRAPPSNEL